MLNIRVALPLILASVVALTACSASDEPAAEVTSGIRITPLPTSEQSLTPSPSPSATPAPMRPTAAPEQRIEAGTVGDGTSASATGEGSAEITFVREGKLAIVVALDCGRCAGATVLTAPERSTPLGEADGALAGSFLVDVTTDSDPEQSLWLQADGEWTIELLSWNDLPLTEGAVEGTGSTVIFFNGDSATSHVTWSPAHDTDMFQGRYFGVDVEDAYFFGDTEAFSEDIKMGLPGVLAIMTDGEWSVTPQ